MTKYSFSELCSLSGHNNIMKVDFCSDIELNTADDESLISQKLHQPWTGLKITRVVTLRRRSRDKLSPEV